MQIVKLNPGQKKLRRWRLRRNALVGRLMAEDRRLTGHEALAKANKLMHSQFPHREAYRR